MTMSAATAITSWIYASPYDIYGYHQRKRASALDYLTNPAHRFFAAFHESELVAFRSFGDDGRVAGGDYDGRYLDTGGGLRPDLTGRGLGRHVIASGLHFGASTYRTTRFRVTIAGFNHRARITCQRLGFEVSQRFTRPHDQQEFLVLTLDSLPALNPSLAPSP